MRIIILIFILALQIEICILQKYTIINYVLVDRNATNIIRINNEIIHNFK